ncbi:TIGR01244 family sulfur transferase [Marinobacter zhejiangensis]|uniref:Sulfide:quinone oxidoreductase n=1 Tax=Marinobacter zhejiangensis TaxID=488535 RepID=A0A1I4RW85_9GAMM|nr:TIGR01244 family sulfur transferase [Marinobacter zhejiangensis]SFM56517.1 sulfide:quinone oxidoreductase [Marinobacter zhejiangensis]
MDLRKIDDDITVTPQIQVGDVETAARLGFRTIIANRPDFEEPGQPAMADIEKAAVEAGLAWVYQPVQSGNIFDHDVERFAEIYEQAEKPILAFCRSGTRCCALWVMSQSSKVPADALLIKAYNAGYDLNGLKPRLQYFADKR